MAPADDASAPARAPDPAAGKKTELTAKERRRLKRAAERADGGAPETAAPSETAAAPSEPRLTAKERRRLKRAGKGDAWEAAKKARTS